MRKWMIAGVMLASCTLASAQESSSRADPDATPSGNWFTRLWSIGDKPAPKKTADAPAKKSEPTPAELAAKQRAKEEATLNRRNEVILKLREIAVRTHDDLLLRKADDLEERAWNLYLERTDANSSVPAAGFSDSAPDGNTRGERR